VAGGGTLFAGTALLGCLALVGCSGEIGASGAGGGGQQPGNPGGPPAGGIPSIPGVVTTPGPTLCANPSAGPSVGVSPLRRLTRSQYNHTIRDLLGLPGDHAAKLGLDEKVGLFFSNANTPVQQHS